MALKIRQQALQSRLSIAPGRVLALGLLFVAISLASSFAWAICAAFVGNQREIEDRRIALAKASALAGQDAAIDEWIADLDHGIDRSVFVTGDGGAASSAAIQATLVSIIATHGAVMTSFRPIQGESAEGVAEVPVEIAFSGGYESTITILHAIETAKPFLVIERAQFRAVQRGQADTRIESQIAVHGYVYRGGSLVEAAGL